MNDNVVNQAAVKPAAESAPGADRQAALRNENNNGRTLPRRAANRWHSLIVSNAAVALGSRTQGHKSEFYVSNMRVRLPNGMINVPDLAIVNTEPAFADQNLDLLLNPTIVIEVVSTETQSVDKTQKLESLLAMESIRECLLVKQDEMRVEHYARQNAKQWIYRIYNERDDVISLESIATKISLGEIYAQIKFGQQEFLRAAS